MKWIIILLMGMIFALCKAQIGTPTTLSVLGLTQLILKTGWNLIEDRIDINLPISIDHKEKKILQKMEILDKKILHLGNMVTSSKLEVMSEVVSYVARTIKVELKFNDLIQYIDDVDYAYSHMQEYAANKDTIDRSTLEDFARSVVSHQASSVKMLMEKIHRFIVPTRKFLRHSSLLELLTSAKDMDSNSVCMSRQSPNQFLYNLYNMISLTQMKGYSMIQFSYMLLEMYGKGSYSTESQLARNKFINRSLETAEEMQNAMNKASLHLWRCDPDKYERGINYLEITQLLQGYIQNEVDLNSDGTCKENCGYYQYTKSHSCFENLYCRQQRRCKGRIFNCQYIDSDMWVCPSDASSGRRYRYVEYENGRILGQKGSCPNNRVKVDSWWRWLFWHCSYCMCLCDEEGVYSDRYFSLRQSVSDVAKNKVVTGLRFTKKNRIIYLQVQHAELLPHGVINDTTMEWVPVDDMKITDRYVYNRQDYFTLNWENRAVDLDVLQGESGGQQKDGYVLTGVRFKTIGSHLNFEIRVTPFDFETGKLRSPRHSSEWKDNVNTEFSVDRRTRINLHKVDVPTKTKAQMEIQSTHNQFIEFTHTDLDKDAAQTTVPFLDSQNVVPLIPMPISGAGIYFKSTPHYGGYIGLKLVTYDFSKHLNFTFNEIENLSVTTKESETTLSLSTKEPEFLVPEPESN